MGKKQSIKFVLMSFYPDYVATGELLYEIGLKFVKNFNVDLSVLTAQPSFVKKSKLAKKETLNGIKIERISIINLNKNSFLGKVLNTYSFFFIALINLVISKKQDWLFIPTSPPLLPLLGAFLKLIKKQKYICLLEDVYPEIAWKLGYIKKNGIICKIWDYLQKISLKQADKLIVLSQDMKDYVVNWCEGIDQTKIHIIHHHANEETIKIISKQENHFFDKFHLKDKFIVEYSGNIGRIHEFKTFMKAAKELKDEKDIIFIFVGDGGKKREIELLINEHNLYNVKLLPYQERSDLSYSIGMGDIHLISVDDGYESLAAPSKLYGILAAGKPFIYVGNRNYLSQIAGEYNCGYDIRIGDYKKVVEIIKNLKNSPDKLSQLSQNSRKLFEENFTLDIISEQYYGLVNREIK